MIFPFFFSFFPSFKGRLLLLIRSKHHRHLLSRLNYGIINATESIEQCNGLIVFKEETDRAATKDKPGAINGRWLFQPG